MKKLSLSNMTWLKHKGNRLCFRAVSFIAAACVCILSAGCSGNKTVGAVNTKPYGDFQTPADISFSGTVCENFRYTLMWDDTDKQVSFLDKASGTVWSQAPAGTRVKEYDEAGMPIKNNPNTQSAVIVHYFDPETLDEKRLLSSTDAVQNGIVYTEKIKDGIRVTYEFVDYEIAVPVEFAIQDDCFSITVYPDQIYDNGKSYVTAISIAPFICGIKNNSESDWLFIPDGSGTVIFPEEVDSVGSLGSKEVYGNDAAVQTFYYNSSEAQVNFPVFGVKTGGSALFGIIDSGDSQAQLAWNIGSKDVKHSSVYPLFRIRGYNMIKPPNGFNSPLTEVQYFAKYINTTPLTVNYYSLTGGDADIYGMAKQYRTYLQQKGLLANKNNSKQKIGVKLIGGTEKKDFVLGLPVTKLYALTTVKDAQNIAERLYESLSDNFYLNLTGFGLSGLDSGKPAGGYKVSPKLGGNKALKVFADKMKEYKLDWFMDFDLIGFHQSGLGFSKKDAAVLPNGQVAFMQSYDNITRNSNRDRSYLLSRSKLTSAAELLADKAEAMELEGISLDSISHTKYSDYISPEYSACGNIGDDVKKLIVQLKNEEFKYLANAPNGYAAFCADRVIDAPLYSSAYSFSSYDVPFYGLVLDGFIPLNSVSVNLCADQNDAVLRCVESGILPSFTLSANYENALITSKHSALYGTSAEGGIQNVISTYGRLKEYMQMISDSFIADYTVRDTLRITTFENGAYAAVNYSDSDVACEYGSVPAHGWIMGRRNG